MRCVLLVLLLQLLTSQAQETFAHSTQRVHISHIVVYKSTQSRDVHAVVVFLSSIWLPYLMHVYGVNDELISQPHSSTSHIIRLSLSVLQRKFQFAGSAPLSKQLGVVRATASVYKP
jgi:hypothetical protein